MDEEDRKQYILSRLGVEKEQLLDLEERDMEELIRELDAIRKESVEEGRYLDADNAKNKIQLVRTELGKKQKKDLASKHSLQKDKLDEEFEQEVENFSDFWNEKIGKYQEECKNLEGMLLAKNQEELEAHYKILEETLPLKFKPSSKMLEVKETLIQLLRNQKYKDAHYMQQKICKLEKFEEEKHINQRIKKIQNLLEIMRNKHDQENKTLRKKILLGLEELELNRGKEYEKLLLKFNNIKKNINNHQTMESYYFNKSVQTSQISKSLKNPFQSVNYPSTMGQSYGKEFTGFYFIRCVFKAIK